MQGHTGADVAVQCRSGRSREITARTWNTRDRQNRAGPAGEQRVVALQPEITGQTGGDEVPRLSQPPKEPIQNLSGRPIP